MIGAFDTEEVRPSNKPRAVTSRVVSFIVPYPAPPHLALGPTKLDVGNCTKVRAKPFVENIKADRFNTHLDSWDDTPLYHGICT